MVDSGNHRSGGNGASGSTAVPPELFFTESLGSFVTQPIVVLDAEGNLAYFNEAAERLVGGRYAEIGPLPPEEWKALFLPTNVEGSPIPLERLPLMRALSQRRPTHGWLNIVGLDGVSRRIESTAFPLVAPDGGLLGAFALFWEQAGE